MTTMRNLIWKDLISVRPLILAIVAGIVVVNLIALGALSLNTVANERSIYVAMWFLMPNLVALGTPALLVGTEEENGTLAWLRTLPIKWSAIADSKFIVAVIAVGISWLIATACYLFVLQWSDVSSTDFAGEIHSLPGILYLIFFSMLLLLTGFTTAYTFRSPVAGLVAVIPLIGLASGLISWFANWYRESTQIYNNPLSNSELAFFSAGGLALLTVGWLLQRWLAHRRLVLPRSHPMAGWIKSPEIAPYRPPIAMSLSRPPRRRALVWQQFRQIGVPGIVLSILLAYGAVVSTSSAVVEPNANNSALIPWIVLFSCWLGGLAFYGDNVRGRHQFLADRGVNPTTVWWTRLAVPLAYCLGPLMLGLILYELGTSWTNAVSGRSEYSRRGDPLGLLVFGMTGFAVGQLVGQWMRRPVLTFFAGPALLAIGLLLIATVTSIYGDYPFWVLLVGVPALLMTTWLLAKPWCEGRVGRRYHLCVVICLVTVTLLPLGLIASSRYLTTPPERTAWRSSMQSRPGRVAADSIVYPGALTWSWGPAEFRRDNDPLESKLSLELEADRIGEFVAFGEVRGVLESELSTPEVKMQAIAVLLDWANKVRERAAAGEESLATLETVEPVESMAVDAITQLTDSLGKTPELKQLVDAIPSRELREESRRRALVGEWQQFQGPWNYRSQSGIERTGKTFMGWPIATQVASLPFERTRADRYVDELVKLMLDQLRDGLPDFQSPEFALRGEYWSKAGGLGSNERGSWFGVAWNRGYDAKIDRLRDRYSD